MDLKRLLMPSVLQADEKLYYRRDDKTQIQPDGSIRFGLDGRVDFDTYFNSFSTGKWAKYTHVERVQAALVTEGTFSIELVYQYLEQDKIKTEVISSTEVTSQEPETFIFDFGKNREQGMFFFRCQALAEDSVLHGGKYLSENLMPTNMKINFMVDICTFRREEYVYRNLELLQRDILENPESPLCHHLYVHISDNAKTLDSSAADGDFVKITPNRNVGGVGGFTRGIIEALNRSKQQDISHVLLMDDDAMIEPACLETNYTFLTVLKEEYKDYTFAGAIMQLDKTWSQYERGAQWNEGYINALRHKVDMREPINLLLNEEEQERVDYAGWWYACIPLSVIGRDNLPLPIFIHRDDVEYGLRTGKGFIYLNGVCVWHEAFENKVSGPLEYYDIRNLAIVNSIHYPDYSAKDFKRILFKWASSSIARYRYKYTEMNLRGAEDFCKGIDWFLNQEAESLHKEICAMNYKAQPKEKFIGYKGITEKDFDWEDLITPDKSDIIPKWKKVLHMMTLNGHIFPVRKSKVMVTSPYNNIYKMYRCSEAIFVDAGGNCVSNKRSIRQMIACYKKVFKTMKVIDKNYEKAKQSYRDRYREMTNMEFWRKYLEM